MTWGRGHGRPWGGGPVVPPGQPTSQVGGLPTAFDFTDEPDGVVPGGWSFYLHNTNGLVVTGEPEPDPGSYFSVVNGLGWWQYRRAPAVGDPYDERGWAASPNNVVEGRNYRLLLVFAAPTTVLDDGQDELEVEVILAGRGNDVLTDYVGARARARWLNGVWVEPLALELVRAQSAAPAVLAAASPDPAPDLVDIWRAGGNGWAELELELRGATATATLNGVVQTTAQVPGASSQVGVLVKARRRVGAGWESVPLLVGFEAQTLRDLDALGPAPQLLGSEHLEAHQLASYGAPVREWLELGYLKRIGGRQFEALQDVDADLPGSDRLGLRVGNVLRAVEPYVGQELTQVVLDLTAARGRGR